MNRQGYSILEAVVAMTIFAIGALALSQSYFGVMRAHVTARNHELAMQCARDRMEEIVNTISYGDISEDNYPDESYGDVGGGDSMYETFSRNVSISDSTNTIGLVVLKEITIQVNWQTSQGERNVSLNSVVARRKDIQI